MARLHGQRVVALQLPGIQLVLPVDTVGLRVLDLDLVVALVGLVKQGLHMELGLVRRQLAGLAAALLRCRILGRDAQICG